MENAFKMTLITKINSLQEIVKNVIRSNQIYKTMEFLELNELNSCIMFAKNIYTKLNTCLNNITTSEVIDESNVITLLQDIVFEISTLISLYGCDTLESLIQICIGNKYVIDDKYVSKYNLLNTFISPMRYRILDWKKNKKIKLSDESIIKTADNFDCFDMDSDTLNFKNRVYGIKVAIHNIEKQHTILVYGVIEDMVLDLISNDLIKNRINEIKTTIPKEPIYDEKSYNRFISCLTLKDVLVHSNATLHEKYAAYMEEFINNISKKSLIEIINSFMEKELFDKRSTLISLLVNSNESECHYLAYLLYDLLSNDIRGMIDTYEQTMIYDSLPFNIKKYFREAMKHIIDYTNKLSKIDLNKISLEQRICLMKTEDSVKEKAMTKLKEAKLKSEDTGSKSMQYVEGLLKIPFGIYKEEQILRLMPEIISSFSTLVSSIITSDLYTKSQLPLPFPIKSIYTSVEIYHYIALIRNNYQPSIDAYLLTNFKMLISSMSKTKLITIYDTLKHILEKGGNLHYSTQLLSVTGKTVSQLRTQLVTVMEELLHINSIKDTIKKEIIYHYSYDKVSHTNSNMYSLNTVVNSITDKINNIHTFMKTMVKTLDDSVYGHSQAKRQIERIIGQWINGDSTGYCFGFEGPPGVGKTSLAKKGIANCLKDEHGVSRPFAFIAMGGSTNSSTLDGHNYTYVGSTWGRIVDILMDTKIMNPIIFIDELDKVSKTENGKEIIGILTHLIDQTQNDSFQDKYFNGINLNLSKALFIFSYNDAELIDKILLDRIHRIKFKHLTLDDKIIIMRNFILPELYKKMGLIDMIEISDFTIEYIINNYTSEPGVRKLKEIMFEIIGEINLSLLKNESVDAAIPIRITTDDIRHKYLKEIHEIKTNKIHSESSVGIINGLWANSLGHGGILPIEASFFPSGSFLDLKLTGMQGDVMKESMTVAKSLAWSLFAKRDPHKLKTIQKNMEESKNQGIHIHVPEGATHKDGPSAGVAITMVLYSLFNDIKIKNNVAITGEICLQGNVTAIGGLDLKIMGGLHAGVKTFIYPRDNQKDYNDFMEKYSKKNEIKDIRFIAVSKIEEVIPLIFD